jgi:DMSO/TMAO reductase YedYZ molybdopterin-dependent catalytic subunit
MDGRAFLTRRELLVLPCAYHLMAEVSSAGGPENIAFPLEGIQGTVTPPELFFVREHFVPTQISLRDWRLHIEGNVAHPLELRFADLLESPSKEVEAVLECAGNLAGGSAVSNAVWEGVGIAELLSQAGIARNSQAVLLEGSDSGQLLAGSPRLPYCQVVPIEKCSHPESLVAFKLNGRFLPRRNGFPARAVFPGWYGMDSVKWLKRLVVLGPSGGPSEFVASGMNKLYNRMLKTPSGEIALSRLAEIQVRSAIAWPLENARLPAGQHTVRGFAWTGTGRIRDVSFTSDGGRTWAVAKLDAQPKPFTWVRWAYQWASSPGDHVLMSRARDDAGNEQPLVRDPARRDVYEQNVCAPVRCVVR